MPITWKSLFAKAQIDQLSPNMARAVLEVLSQGRDRIPEITGIHKVDATGALHVLAALKSLRRNMVERLEFHLMDAVLNRDYDREDGPVTPTYGSQTGCTRGDSCQWCTCTTQRSTNETIKKFLGVSERLSGIASSTALQLGCTSDHVGR